MLRKLSLTVRTRPNHSQLYPARAYRLKQELCGKNNDKGVNYLIPTTLLRFGLTGFLELRIANQFTGVSENKNPSKYGISDPEPGIKVQILKKENLNVEIAFVSHFILPCGSGFLSNTKPGTINRIAI